jgi:hypothetical protein
MVATDSAFKLLLFQTEIISKKFIFLKETIFSKKWNSLYELYVIAIVILIC